jgi:biotin transport system substrate-specific component
MEQFERMSVTFAAITASILGGIVVLYLFGIAGMMVALQKGPLETAMLVTAFIPGDMIKAVLAGLITAGLARARPNAVLSRS